MMLDGSHRTSYFLFDAQEQITQLFFSQQLPDNYSSGFRLRVGTSLQSTMEMGAMNAIFVESMEITAVPSAPEPSPASPDSASGIEASVQQVSSSPIAATQRVITEVPTLYILLQICQQPAAVSVKVGLEHHADSVWLSG